MELKIVNLSGRKGDKPEERAIIANSSDKVSEFKALIKTSLGIKLPENRIGLYFEESADKKVYLSNNDKHLRDYGLNDNTKIFVKDLGPQIGWRFTYIFEYLGPFFLVILFFICLGPSKA